MKINLDRKKPFNAVFGHLVIKYGQDGEYFDAQGRNIKAPAAIKNQEEQVRREVEAMKEEARERGLLKDKPALSQLSAEEAAYREDLAAEAAEDLAT